MQFQSSVEFNNVTGSYEQPTLVLLKLDDAVVAFSIDTDSLDTGSLDDIIVRVVGGSTHRPAIDRVVKAVIASGLCEPGYVLAEITERVLAMRGMDQSYAVDAISSAAHAAGWAIENDDEED